MIDLIPDQPCRLWVILAGLICSVHAGQLQFAQGVSILAPDLRRRDDLQYL